MRYQVIFFHTKEKNEKDENTVFFRSSGSILVSFLGERKEGMYQAEA